MKTARRAEWPAALLCRKKEQARTAARLLSGVRVPVALPGLQGDLPGGEELLDGAEVVPLGVEGVHDLQGGLHRLGEDVVHEDNAPVPGRWTTG